jgi:hypothetical protein
MMKMTRRTVSLAAVAGLLVGGLGLAGCQSAGKGGSMGIVNSRCPMTPNCGKSPTAANSVEHRGERVGFCCGGCISEWNQLSDAERDAKLAAVK